MNRKKILLAVICTISSAALVSAKDIVTDTLGVDKAVATSPAELLKGELSGVRVSSVDGNPNGVFNVNIRGLNTFRGDSQPLWIVDGAVIGSSVNQNLNAFYLNGSLTTNGDKLPDYSGQSYTYPLGNFGWLNPYEIESIEVIKDMSVAVRYGMHGANGVIIIKTGRAVPGKRSIRLSSNVGIDFSPVKGEAFRTGIYTMHNLGVSGMIDKKSYYNISGFFKYDDTAIKNAGSMTGGLAVNLETTANEIFQFGLNSFLNYGNYTSTAGTNFIGAPSTMMLSRFPDSFEDDSISGWLSSSDDEVIDYRTVNSVWLQINFLRSLYLKMTAGMDYQNQTRYLWFGSGTSFGKEFSGATGILSNSLLTYNFNGELNFNRNFAVRHHLYASLAFDLNGNLNKHNAMCGTDFSLPYLRGKGLSSSGSLHAIRRFSRSYTELGGYAGLGYDYNGYAGISGTARIDWTARFDRKPTVLPAGEAWVDFGRMFLQGNTTVSTLKISGGYGSAGRESILPYEDLSTYISGVPEVAAGAETYFDGINRLVSTEYNVGIDLGFMNDRFNLAFRFYDKKTDDSFKVYNFGKIVSDLWVETANWSVLQERSSSIMNRGFEFDAGFHIIDNRNIDWTLWVNASYNINRALSVDKLDLETPAIVKGRYTAANRDGESIASAWGYKDAGSDPEILGNTIPQVYGGFGTTLSLYGFTLDVKFSGAGGFNIINANRLVESGRGYISAEDIERGDWLRLENVCASYDIPLKVKWIKGLKVNLSAYNLCTFTGYSGWNPDVNSFGVTARSNGADYGSFPLRRSVVLGVSLKF